MVEGQLNKSGLNPDNFRKTLNGKEINLYTLRNSEGNEVSLTNYGHNGARQKRTPGKRHTRS